MATYNYLRLKNIMDNAGDSGVSRPDNPFTNMMPFNPTKFPSVNFDQPQQQDPTKPTDQGDNYNRLKAILDSYTPDTRSNDRLNNLLDTMPQLNKPSVARKFVASGAAMGNIGPHFQHTGGGADAADRVLYAPYLQDMAQFKEKAAPFEAAATLENNRNIQERTLTTNLLAAAAAQDKSDATSRDVAEKNRITEKNNDMRNAVAQTRAAAYAAKNNGWTIQKDGNRFVGLNPSTHQWENLGPAEGMPREDEINLLSKGRVAAAEATGTAALNRQTAAGTGVFQDAQGNRWKIGPNGDYIPMQGGPAGPLNKVGTPGAGTKPNALELNRERQNKLQDQYENDVTTHDFIKKTPDGKYDMTTRPILNPDPWFGHPTTQADIDRWDALKHHVDPNYNPPPREAPIPSSVQNQAPTRPQQQQQQAPSQPQQSREDELLGLLKSPNLNPRQQAAWSAELSGIQQGNKDKEAQGAKDNNRRMEIEYLLEDPKVSGRQRADLQSELNRIKGANTGLGPTQTPNMPNQQPPTPAGRVPVYDKQGNLMGHIPDTPEQRSIAAAQGLVVR